MTLRVHSLMAVILLCLPMRMRSDPTIVWSGPQDIPVGLDGVNMQHWLPEWSLDVNSDGVMDFLFDIREIGDDFLVACEGDNRVTTQNRGPFSSWLSWPLPEGTVIDADLNSETRWDGGQHVLNDWEAVGNGQASAGPWSGVENMYMGLQFVAADGTHYGWVQLSVYDEYPGMHIHDWAYETSPGFGIQMGMVPEPSTWALFGLGLVVLMVRRMRGR